MKDEKIVPRVENLLEIAKNYAVEAKSTATRRAYKTDWIAFVLWCLDMKRNVLPATTATVAAYLVYLDSEGRKPATLARALVSISQAHKLAGHETPTTAPVVRETLKGIKRTRGTAQRRAKPITVEHLRRLVDVCEDSARGKRDRAALLLGFAGGFRRSELVSIDLDQIEEHAAGLTVTLTRAKTDQEGASRMIGVPFGEYEKEGEHTTCPVRALRSWLDCAGIKTGPVFRSVGKSGRIGSGRLSARSVDRIVKSLLENAGYSTAGYSAHSLRSGLATAAAGNDSNERDIMRHTGHKSPAQLRNYIHEGTLFSKNVLDGLL